MCGLIGIMGQNATDSAVLTHACVTLQHRGPDAQGIWIDKESCVALGHRRLAILDLSDAGAQPMVSRSGRYVIAFNGEVYNHLEIRVSLDGPWLGHSDTETLLAAIELWGIEATLKKIVGMFALALWDRKKKKLTLARDRLGEKPLYYGVNNDSFLFGSELKALRAYPGFNADIDRDALALYLRHNYIPAPYCIYKGINKLPAGSFLQIELGQSGGVVECGEPVPFWSVHTTALQGQANPFSGTDEEACDELEHILRRSIAGQMITDVPLGAFLSGGVDSSTVVALMQAQSSLPVQTFTIGFKESAYNEAVHAKTIAQHLGCDHMELYVNPEEAQAVIPQLPTIYDEPFADSSQIPSFLVARLAREHVTVSLSGDGGDELFGGYTRYFWASALWDKIKLLPAQMRRTAAKAVHMLSPVAWDRLAAAVPTRWRPAHPGDKAYKLAAILRESSPDAIYRWLISQWQQPEDIVIGGREPLTPIWDASLQRDFPDFMDRMQYLDTVSYLPDDILTKVDRASMAVSLEVRVPLLDHRMVEFAWHQPRDRKIRGGQGKWLLRQVLDRYVPRSLIERPKMGFGVPIDAWLRGPLREWAEELLDERRIREAGLLNPAPIRQKWEEHLSGRQNWQYPLWGVLMFQAWHERWG